MDAFQRLVNEEVVASIENDETGEIHEIKGVVMRVNVEDYYFYEKNESISITISLNPLSDLPSGFDLEDMEAIPLSYIRKH